MTKKYALLFFGTLYACGGKGTSTVPPNTDGAQALVDAATQTTDGAKPPSVDAAVPADPRDAPGIFSAAGNHMRHVRSLDDGKTWVDDATDIAESMTGDDYGIRTVSWGNGVFVAFAAKVFTSADAKTWVEVPKADGQWLASMIYAQGEYVSSGGYGWLATTTTDLGTWTQHPPSANYTTAHHSQSAIAYGTVNGASAYVVVDDSGNLFHATDGKTWQTTTGAPVVPAGNTWGTKLVYGGGVFLGLLPSGKSTIRSTDGGATWTSNPDLSSGVQGIEYAQGKFTLLGSGHVFTSTDGATFTDHAETTAIAADLTYGHGTYLALGSNSTIYRSTDGLTFTKALASSTNPDPIAWIAFGPTP